MARIRQVLAGSPPLDVASALKAELGKPEISKRLKPGARVVVGVGSRGIDRLAEVVRAVVRCLEQGGTQPFLMPAMGSHGGATPEGQKQLLSDYGVTAESMGVPLEAAMDAELIGRTADGEPVYCSKVALSADAVLIVNRVKPHTDFGGALGSGLLKMSVVGLGKHAGAIAFHRAAQRLGHERALRTMSAVVAAKAPLVGGVALVEDPLHRLARLEVVPGDQFEAVEPRLAAEAARAMPRLPLEDIDLLIVDRIGKNISGTGMDPNIIGRMIHGYSLIEKELPEHPRIRRIFVRELTPESHGNALGIGMADFTTTRFLNAMDRELTYTNSITALSLQGAKAPIHFDTDREAIAAALITLGLEDIRRARVVRILDTLSLQTLSVSESCLAGLGGQPGLSLDGQPADMSFDEAGNLTQLEGS